MDFSIEEKGPVRRLVAVTISGEDLRAEEGKSYSVLRARTNMKGFRKGKVPQSVLKKRYGKQVRQDAMNALVNSAVQPIVKDIDKMVHLSPYRVVEERTEGGGFRFEVDVEVKPEIDVKGYLGIEVQRPEVEVSDEEIQEELDKKLDAAATKEPVEGREIVESGDTVSLDYESLDEEKPMNATDVAIEIGTGQAIPGFEEGLLGMTIGEEKVIDVELPASSPEEEVTTLKLKVTPRAITLKVLPELDDEFAKGTGDAETLDELKTVIRTGLEESKAKNSDTFAKTNLREVLREANPFELPHGYIDDRVQRRMEEHIKMLTQQGIPREHLGMFLDGIGDRLVADVTGEVQDELIFQSIAENEEITVSDEEREEHMVNLAAQMQMELSVLRSYYTRPEMQDTLNEQIRQEKAVALVFEAATFVAVKEEEPAAESDEETVEAEVTEEATVADAEPENED